MDSVHMKYDVPWVFFSSFCSLCCVLLFLFLYLRLCVRVFAPWMVCVVILFCLYHLFFSFSVSFRFVFFLLLSKPFFRIFLFSLEPAYNQRTLYANLFALNCDCGKKKIEHRQRHTHTHSLTKRKTVEKMREMLIAPCMLSFLILFSLV